jgi:hypothetical protein
MSAGKVVQRNKVVQRKRGGALRESGPMAGRFGSDCRALGRPLASPLRHSDAPGAAQNSPVVAGRVDCRCYYKRPLYDDSHCPTNNDVAPLQQTSQQMAQTVPVCNLIVHRLVHRLNFRPLSPCA